MSTRRARFAIAIPFLVAVALVATDCNIDPFCQDGSPGCAKDACANHQQDGDETDVDCGGSCAPCASGAACGAAADCASNRCFGGMCCEPPCLVDARSFGGTGFDRITRALYLPDGTLVVTGEMHDTVDFGGGPLISAGGTDVFVVGFAPDGSVVWQRRFGGSKEDGGPVMDVTPSGHVFVGGIFQAKLDTGAGVLPNSGGYADIFLIELDGSGNTVQARALSSQATSVGISDIAATADGGVVITGNMGRLDFGDGTVLISDNGPFPGGPVDAYVAKLDAHLDRVWDRQLGNADNDFTSGIEIDPAGDVVMGVLSTSDTTFGGPALAAPGFSLVAYGGEDGAYRWGRAYGAGIPGAILSMDAQGELLLLGTIAAEADLGTGKLRPTGTRTAFAARITGEGDPAWVTLLPSDIETYPLAVRRDPGGGVLAALGVTGDLSAGGVTADTGADSLVFVRLDEAGNVEWARNVGGIVLATGVGLSETPAGYALAYGGYAGTLNLGALGPADGASDAFVATLLP